MATDATALQFLDTLASIEEAELTAAGIKQTFGHKSPTNIAGQFPCILGGVVSWQWRPESGRGQSRTQEYGGVGGPDQPGAWWNTYRVRRYIVIGAASEALETSLDKAMQWPERYRDALLKHITLYSTVFKCTPLGGSMITLPIGGAQYRTVANDLEIITISNPVVLP